MIRQVYFSVKYFPLPADTMEEFFRVTAGNLSGPIGAASGGRELYRALCEEDVIDDTFLALDGIGKEPIICGVFDQGGARVAGHDYDAVERARFFWPVDITDPETGETVATIPADNTAAGWALPDWS